MKLIVLAVLSMTAIVTGCASVAQQADTPKFSQVNRCLHFDECDGRPYPRRSYASSVDPKYLSADEGLGYSSPGKD